GAIRPSGRSRRAGLPSPGRARSPARAGRAGVGEGGRGSRLSWSSRAARNSITTPGGARAYPLPMTAARAARIGTSRLRNAAIAAGAALFLRAALPAQEVAVSLDPGRTTIAFSLGTTFHTVHGSFKLKRGALHFDTATGDVRGEIVVDTQSGESGNASRDKRMRDEILETPRFPTAVFRPDRFEGRLSADGDSQGNL